uniref:Uncharacterized protein n=1 Tax=Glossina palpalis gambiensis TaxID=67801 RepID=A0A1B0BBC0_9MUSC
MWSTARGYVLRYHGSKMSLRPNILLTLMVFTITISHHQNINDASSSPSSSSSSSPSSSSSSSSSAFITSAVSLFYSFKINFTRYCAIDGIEVWQISCIEFFKVKVGMNVKFPVIIAEERHHSSSLKPWLQPYIEEDDTEAS